MSRSRKLHRLSNPDTDERRAQRMLFRHLRDDTNANRGRMTKRVHELQLLLAMDPVEFEQLIARLMEAMGMKVELTARSRDGGVDVRGIDTDPFRGGNVIVQVKRYRDTVTPSAVRDLYGTLQHDRAATKAVLVTTSRFGPSSHQFVAGKPIALINGAELVGLLKHHGFHEVFAAARFGGAGGGEELPEVEVAAEPARLLLHWTGEQEYDIAALVCRGNRALSDEHLVFYNNGSTPDGSVRLVTGYGDANACLMVDFDALPADADRLVIVAAADTGNHPAATMAGFAGPALILEPGADQAPAVVHLADGARTNTAMRLGRFDRDSAGDRDFTPALAGYPGGLHQAVVAYGLEVDDA
ncbi:restriction endonuclease [Kitasatospora sp. NBC_00240]|uniref:restriction endonuclease n=1 Tax=Kitasatospora sp. NBC_00240 TaxID=2903567 RepID=UPI00224D7F6F|nr:restriction endonuclease [Kitasatospora sp. NBC_00240]MCX5207759.1 restriction endonuclease [Kitasatospora sp. NBC_00240]MCX5215342.1 restriction endonuclease [Kitasatospora sp. NBC_00240]MCX5216097.1 restriction endonuclease [Kitasatospora sp. NBC_00240]